MTTSKFDYIYHDAEFWFSQLNMSKILGIQSHTVNWHLKEIEKAKSLFKIKQFPIKQMEGSRLISRTINHYPLECLFDVAMRSNRLSSFNKAITEIEKTFTVDLDFEVRPIKERNFKEILDKSLQGILEFKYQHQVSKYIIDFYFPELNLCVEYDETHHKHTVEKDVVRETAIKKLLHCDFLRVQEGKELEGLNKLIRLKLLKE